MSVRNAVGIGVMGVSYAAMTFFGIIIHAWTVVIAFSLKGIIGAAIALVTPFVAEMYILYRIYSVSETLLNPYIISMGIYLALWIPIFIGAMIVEK